MTKDVIIKISGTQFAPGVEPENIEVISKGTYYLKDGKHYILYDEVYEQGDEVTKSRIKINGNQVNIQKRGVTSLDMQFEKNKKNISCFGTPFGQMMIGVEANDIKIQQSDQKIEAEIAYAMDMNYEYLADHKIHILIQSQDTGEFRING